MAADKHEAVVTIPEVVRMTVVAVEPEVIVIVFNIEHFQVAVRISNI